ncbi:MAG: DsbA family protein [Hyphomicrobium sp.]|jgi:protein-disulfide isomerase|uniref:DsbA family protein n=1 Tax=Hyphomicrobium sp. TaxID=82 RepID=UPI0025BB6B3C|nr:DsbA family protein [Hyphomicrobium sp.]MBX9864504.1 DsbA family protein [Hyphomicrobium sp.]
MRARAQATLAVLGALFLAACSGNTSVPNLSPGAAAPSGEASAFNGSPVEAASDSPMGAFGSIPDPTQGARQIIQNPSVAEIMAPGTLPEMTLGRADAPVTIIQYQSLTCPHCRAFHRDTFPEFERTYIKTGKVRFIMREFPIGKQSGQATIALRCAPPDKYFALYGKFMEQQASWVSQEVRLDPIFAVAKQVGMTRAQFDACYQNQAMIEGLKWVKDRGRTLGIIGTPNFFVAGKLVKKTLTMADIRELVDPLLTGQAAASASVAR